MVVNFKTRKISRDASKLTRTSTLKKKKALDMMRLFKKPSLKGSKIGTNSIIIPKIDRILRSYNVGLACFQT
jgi:hypothetical protein